MANMVLIRQVHHLVSARVSILNITYIILLDFSGFSGQVNSGQAQP